MSHGGTGQGTRMNSFFPESILKPLRQFVDSLFNTVGFEVRRKTPVTQTPNLPPPLFDDPIEALYQVRGGEKAAFRCPLTRLVEMNGFGFGAHRWHPMVSTVKCANLFGYAEADQLLGKYYDSFQPRSAGEAIPSFEHVPRFFEKALPHIYYLSPWSARSPERIDTMARIWTYQENLENGRDDLFLDPHGFAMHGPVHPDKRKLELDRLMHVRDSISRKGFDERFSINVRVLKRDDELLFVVNGGGRHRSCVMAALGYEWVPASFFPGPIIIDVADVELWPSVRSGIWTVDQAIAYVDHLFEFDSRSWAEARGLSVEQSVQTFGRVPGQ